jgi:hypothetical protein
VAAQLEVGRKTTGERASIGPKRPRGPAWRGGKLKKIERASWAKKLLWAKVEFGMARENRNVLQFFFLFSKFEFETQVLIQIKYI